MSNRRQQPSDSDGLKTIGTQAVLDSIGNAIVVLDASGCIVAKNSSWDRFCQESGAQAESIDVGASYYDICRSTQVMGDEYAAPAIEGIRSVAEGNSSDFSLEYPCGSGSRQRWFTLHAASLPAPSGRGAVVTHTNSTAHHEAEDAVQRRTAEVAAIVDTAVDGIITIDANGLVESFNPAAERMFGYSESELKGHNVSTIMPAPYRAEHDGYLGQYLRTDKAKIIGTGREVIGLRKDGSTFPLWLSVGEQELQGARKFTGILHDLTRMRREQERGLALSRILEESLNEIFIFEAESLRFVQVNEGARRNLGYSLDELRSMTPIDIKPDHSEATFRELISPLRAGGELRVVFETRHKRKDGTFYPAEIHLQLAHFEGGLVYVAIILDITERQMNQRRLEQWNEELQSHVAERTKELAGAQRSLEQKNRFTALGQLAGGVAHEIRNPLGVIGNTTYYLQSLLSVLPPDARDCVEDIAREVATADRIVGELLDYMRQSTPTAVKFCLRESLVRAAASVARPENVSLALSDTGETALYVVADFGQIERALANLVRNAIQAMATDTGGELELRCFRSDDEVIAEVVDSGPGIAAEQLARIFEPLYTSKSKGIGLGLAVATRYAEMNGGRVEAESRIGVGSVFRLRIPIADEGKHS